MPLVTCGMAAFTVATIFYAYRAYIEALGHKQRVLRERVTYMLWMAANAVAE